MSCCNVGVTRAPVSVVVRAGTSASSRGSMAAAAVRRGWAPVTRGLAAAAARPYSAAAPGVLRAASSAGVGSSNDGKAAAAAWGGRTGHRQCMSTNTNVFDFKRKKVIGQAVVEPSNADATVAVEVLPPPPPPIKLLTSDESPELLKWGGAG